MLYSNKKVASKTIVTSYIIFYSSFQYYLPENSVRVRVHCILAPKSVYSWHSRLLLNYGGVPINALFSKLLYSPFKRKTNISWRLRQKVSDYKEYSRIMLSAMEEHQKTFMYSKLLITFHEGWAFVPRDHRLGS